MNPTKLGYHLQGFSLIELSIVLVIIGLIVGGIFVGTDLIKGAEIRSTIGQLESYKNAVHSFKAKYKCLPGDCANAISKGLNPGQGPWIGSMLIPDPSGDIGNDNGIVVDTQSAEMIGNPSIHLEGINFWAHLQNAGMVTFPPATGVFYQQPISALGRGHWTAWSSILNINALYITEQWGGVIHSNCGGDFFCPSLSPFEAYQIDKKMDDGLPDPVLLTSNQISGGATIGTVNAFVSFSMIGQPNYFNDISRGAMGSNNCLDNTKTPIAYNSQVNTPNLCLLQFKMDY